MSINMEKTPRLIAVAEYICALFEDGSLPLEGETSWISFTEQAVKNFQKDLLSLEEGYRHSRDL